MLLDDALRDAAFAVVMVAASERHCEVACGNADVRRGGHVSRQTREVGALLALAHRLGPLHDRGVVRLDYSDVRLVRDAAGDLAAVCRDALARDQTSGAARWVALMEACQTALDDMASCSD